MGDALEGSLKNNYQYNDKELWDDGDLNWLDYGFRNYDAQIGRFTQLDPLTWDYPYYTPYQYAGCEPITNVDIDGLEPFGSVGKAIASADGVITHTSEVVVKNIKPVLAVAKTTNYVNRSSTILRIAVGTAQVGAKVGVDKALHNNLDGNLKNPSHDFKNSLDYPRDNSRSLMEKIGSKIAWLWTPGDESGEMRTGEVIYGKNKDMSHSRGLPQAGPGSHSMDLGDQLDLIEGLREPLSLIDLIKGSKLQALYKRADNFKSAVENGKEAIEKLKKISKKYENSNEPDSIFQSVPFSPIVKNGDTLGWRGWQTITIPNPKKAKK